MDDLVRTERMFWVKTLIQNGAPDGIEDFIQSMDRDGFFDHFPFLTDDGDYPSEESLLEQFCDAGKEGFLIEAARPVMKYGNDKKSATFSWGHYHTCWLYAETANDIEAVLDKWAQETDAKDKRNK